MLLEELRWKKYPVGSDGFVCLVDVMGDDARVCNAARLSYGAGTRHVSDNKTLIKYLYRHGHMSPFEQVEMQFMIRLPMDIMRQLVRHRTAHLNEYSTRYSNAIDSCTTTKQDEWRLQAATNKQGSDGFLKEWPASVGRPIKEYTEDERFVNYDSPGQYLSNREATLQEFARAVYEERLAYGVAREQARKDLPLCNYTEIYWKIDLRNLLHFLSLRQDSHAQIEIRQIADVLYEIAKQLCPFSVAAYDLYDFRREGLLLSAHEVNILEHLHSKYEFSEALVNMCIDALQVFPPRSRERDECIQKFKRLGLIREKTDDRATTQDYSDTQITTPTTG